MQKISLNNYTHVACPVFGFEVEQGTCVRCKNNMLGDFIYNTTKTERISYCLA